MRSSWDCARGAIIYLIGWKMDANVPDIDVRAFLSDAKVVKLIKDAEKIYEDDRAHQTKAAAVAAKQMCC